MKLNLLKGFEVCSTNLPSRVASLGFGMGHAYTIDVDCGDGRIQVSVRLSLIDPDKRV